MTPQRRWAVTVWLSLGAGLLTVPATLALADNPTPRQFAPEIHAADAACEDAPPIHYDRCWREAYAAAYPKG